jgi:endogenous inhibitor of DNA gyrase (YacG/DUF329 family)
MVDGARCVYCRKRPVEPAFRPFCSDRCRMADLGRWLSGDYRVAGPPADPTGAQDAPERDRSDEDR